MLNRPSSHRGMHHIALNVTHFDACEFFYKDLLGMEVVWRPDANNLYLSSGSDNLALHRVAKRLSGCTASAFRSSGIFSFIA
jgi:catechol 2,3-dioxygenase-like lactoylglutathione lyase family enzyme